MFRPVVIVTVLLVACCTWAADPQDANRTAPSNETDRLHDGAQADDPANLRPTPGSEFRDTPFARELKEIRARQKAQLAELTERLHQKADPRERLAVQHEIGALKQEGELELLRLQIRYAESEGRTEVVEKLQQAITEITSPRQIVVPQDRTADRRSDR